MAMGWFEIKVAKDGQFYFNLKAANSQIILTSEMYKTRRSCDNGIASVQSNGHEEDKFEVRVAKNGKDYFIIKAKNGQEIGRSQIYKGKSGIRNGIKSVMKNSATTVIKDLTVEIKSTEKNAKEVSKKPLAKKAEAKKTVAKKPEAKKTTAKKPVAKKPVAKKSSKK